MLFGVSFATIEPLEFWHFVLCGELLLSYLVYVWWLQVQSLWCFGDPVSFFFEHVLYLGLCEV